MPALLYRLPAIHDEWRIYPILTKNRTVQICIPSFLKCRAIFHQERQGTPAREAGAFDVEPMRKRLEVKYAAGDPLIYLVSKILWMSHRTALRMDECQISPNSEACAGPYYLIGQVY